MKKVFDSILRSASIHVIRDYYEIRTMRSSMGINIAKYVSSSSQKAFSIISSEIAKI